MFSGLESRFRERSPVLWRMYRTFRAKNIPFMAGSVAFTAFLSLLPLLVLLYVVVALVGEGALADQVVAVAESVLPRQASDLLAGSIRSHAVPTGGSILSVVVLLWGALRLFRSLDTAFHGIYAATPDESFLDKLGDSAVALSALIVAIVAAAAAGTVFGLLDVPYVGVLAPVALFVGLVVAFLPIYYVFPDVETSVRSALPGTVVAALGWTLLEALFQVYLSLASAAGESGILGGVVVVLTWLYFGSLVLLAGAVVNAVLSGRVDPLVAGEDAADPRRPMA